MGILKGCFGKFFWLGLWLLAATSHTTCASTVDDVVAAEMKEHHITGVSLAIIENNGISKARGYGFTEQSATTPVTTSTLFQAGSISKWHIYPEMAAAGLWTTASELARFAIAIQQALAGKANPLISQSMTRRMLTIQKGNSGLGLGIDGSGKTLRFSHGGRDEGFDSFMLAYAESGQGVVIMINANDNSGAVNRMVDAVRQEHHWPDPE